MNHSLLVVLIASGIAYGTPLLYAALGELLAERSGVLNLGVEGMMLMGAVTGFWTVQRLHAGAGVALAAAVAIAALAGVAGATFTLAINPQWFDNITGGSGWIAIALVIFAFWRPTLCLVGAYFFGAFTALPFALQGHGVTVAPELFQSLPYVMTVLALVLVSSRAARLRFGAPAALGLPYVREER